MLRGHVLRLYPTEKQSEQMGQAMGCARFVYNYFLSLKQELYSKYGQNLSYGYASEELTLLKQKLPWLKDADKFALQNSLLFLYDAYKNYFEGRAKAPNFKSRKNEWSYQTCFTNGNIRIDAEKRLLRLPKIGWVEYRTGKSHDLQGKIMNVTIKKSRDGYFTASVLIDSEDKPDFLLPTHTAIGCDLGIKTYLMPSHGEAEENPKHLEKSKAKLRRENKSLFRKKEGSKNRGKQARKLARLHRKISNQRNDFLHKLSRRIVDENQVIVLEDLNVKGMVKNRKLSKAISDAAWGTFRRFVEYKAEAALRDVVIIDRFYPSSKKCSICGHHHGFLTLSDREWLCPKCRTKHDRDLNASINILNEGLRLQAGTTSR